jgi:hypothetical protein
MMRKENAALMPSMGTRFASSSVRAFRTETDQTGNMAAPITAQVPGLR